MLFTNAQNVVGDNALFYVVIISWGGGGGGGGGELGLITNCSSLRLE